jgi:hypothetical protein
MHRRSRLVAAFWASLLALALPAVAVANTQEENLILKTGDTPLLRLEQTGGGFTPQTWDVAGNEANFFIRDDTGGSKLPFRIRPGAPTSSIDIRANGNVGFGTAEPNAPIEISRGGAATMLYTDSTPAPDVSWATGIPSGGGSFTIGPNGIEPVFELQSYGELDLAGSLGEAANQASVSEVQSIDPATILSQLQSLPIQSWRYSAGPAGARHLGPLSGSFASVFGLGENPSLISPADEAGVSLVAVQALSAKLATAEASTAALSARNRALTDKVAAIEGSAQGLSSENGTLAARVAKLEPLRAQVGKLAKQLKSLRQAVKKLGS